MKATFSIDSLLSVLAAGALLVLLLGLAIAVALIVSDPQRRSRFQEKWRQKSFPAGLGLAVLVGLGAMFCIAGLLLGILGLRVRSVAERREAPRVMTHLIDEVGRSHSSEYMHAPPIKSPVPENTPGGPHEVITVPRAVPRGSEPGKTFTTPMAPRQNGQNTPAPLSVPPLESTAASGREAAASNSAAHGISPESKPFIDHGGTHQIAQIVRLVVTSPDEGIPDWVTQPPVFSSQDNRNLQKILTGAWFATREEALDQLERQIRTTVESVLRERAGIPSTYLQRMLHIPILQRSIVQELRLERKIQDFGKGLKEPMYRGHAWLRIDASPTGVIVSWWKGHRQETRGNAWFMFAWGCTCGCLMAGLWLRRKSSSRPWLHGKRFVAMLALLGLSLASSAVCVVLSLVAETQ